MIHEADNFLKRGSWKKVKRSKVELQGRTVIGSKWVYKMKDEKGESEALDVYQIDGKHYVRYKSRIVSLGYRCIPGVDYTETFAPVAADTTIRMMIRSIEGVRIV